MDFMQYLPCELVCNILCYLNADEIAALSRCSKLCRRRTNYDKLWLNICKRKGWMKYGTSLNLEKEQCHELTTFSNVSRTLPIYDYTVADSSNLEAICKWKDIFMRAVHLELNWKLGRYTVAPILRGHTQKVNSIDSDGRLVVSGGADRTVRIWDLANCTCLYTLELCFDEVTSVKIKKDLIVSASLDGYIHVIDALSGSVLLNFHSLCIDHIAFDGRYVASTCSDYTLRIWGLQAAKLTHVLQGHTADIECLCMYDELVLTGSYDKTLILWDTNRGVQLHQMHGHHEVVNACQFDRRLAVSASADCTLRMWNTRTGSCDKVLAGHTAEVYCVVYNSEVIVSGSADSAVIVWRLTDEPTGDPNIEWRMSAELRYVLCNHLGVVRCLHLDEKKLISGGDCKRIVVWNYRTGELLNVVHRQPTSLHLMWVNETKLISAAPERPGTITVLNYW